MRDKESFAMERLRAGVIGVGAIAQIMHLPYLRELDDRFQIAALCDVDPIVLAEVGRQYGVDRLFSSADELLTEPLDVVLILSSGDHGPVTIAALERGLHVLVEKPLAYTLRETDDVIAAAERAGKTLMVGMMKQYDPGYQRGVELVQRLRDLRYVEATTLEPEGTLDLLREATGSDDSGVLTSYFLLLVSSIHDVNALRGAIGQPESVLSANLWAGGTSFTTTLAYENDVRTVYTWTMLPYVKNYGETFGFYASDGRVLIRFPSPYLRNAPTLD